MSQYPAVIELSSLDGANGFQINGELTHDQCGFSVSSAGDVNGDGFADLIVGAPFADPTSNGSGASYVVFGRAAAFGAVLELSSLDGNNGFQVNGEPTDEVEGYGGGYSVSSAGDVNGDGFDDVIVGAPYSDLNGTDSGTSHVVFGKASGFGPVLELTSLDGNNGFHIDGEATQDYSGRSVASAGDVNGDGFDDVIVGASGAEPNGNTSGASYVVFGKASGFGFALQLSLLDGNNGFQLNGAPGDKSGFPVAPAGDVNGDGFSDIIVGANYANPHGNDSGASYVLFGKASNFGPTIDLPSLDGTNGFKLNGEATYDYAGWSVASAGDFNGDGFDDLIVGAFGVNANGVASGASYVVFGTTLGFGATLELSSIDGNNGFQIKGEATGDQSGISVASAGDFNGDGFGDVIVGAPGADPHGDGAGASYVVFGKAQMFNATLELSGLDGTNGFQINGEAGSDRSGNSVASAGDLNGDGFDDLVVGGPGADPNGASSGASYVILGSMPDVAVVRTGTEIGNVIHGGNFDDTLSGLSGNDVLTAHDGDDTLIGGDGNDGEDGGRGDDLVRGGSGSDVLAGGPGDDDIRGGSSNDKLDGGFGDDDMRGGSGVDAMHGRDGSDTLGGGSGTDTLYGEGGSDALDGGSDDDTLNGGAGGDTLAGADGEDVLRGNDGNDRLLGGDGKDTLDGGPGADRFVFVSGGDSTSVDFDIVKSADFAADVWDAPGHINGVDTAITGGSLSISNFDTNLAIKADAGHLAAHHAVLYTPSAGGLAGKTFLVIDLNGVGGYQGGIDLVVQLDTPANLAQLDKQDFI